MTCWIVVPVKAPEACKSRLRPVLDNTERHALVADMLRHVVGIAQAMPGVEVKLLGPSRHGIAETLPLLGDPGTGLNDALSGAMASASAAGATRLIVLPGDLPRVARPDIAPLIEAEADRIVIAPDRLDLGTNALSIPLPGGQRFRFGFGQESFAHHRAEAGRLGLRATMLSSPGLSFDVDLPEDLERWAREREDQSSGAIVTAIPSSEAVNGN